jgi:hypothetical protein
MTFNKSFKQSIAIHCIRHEHDLNHTKKSVGCRKEAALPQTDCMFEIYNIHILNMPLTKTPAAALK